ncbi:putative flgM-like regulatory protein (plasmid) [Octadecabacter arcticus 238]|uniref:Negative regulator of flagellin synthesis n=1 Tax=Octadecabacter arcticus 238 TaxID=391616 RepID=M9RSJ2_9RHOB|nr:flagellar biosynthesis anti-sigma factor FlgM [Octadecabacter arcticus]AGI74718.1 putative flgM-like regulatory protein [Octadecabacter arcticus 238]
MVDATQNLTGTVATVSIPEINPIPKVSLSQTSTADTAKLGTSAPVNPISSTSKLSVEVTSVAAEVLASMQNMPPPIDIEAVDQIKTAISENSYPVDLSKIADGLVASFKEMT